MSINRPAAGGGREILVTPQRFLKWIDGFDARHVVAGAVYTSGGMEVAAADGSLAVCGLPLGGGSPDEIPEGDSRTRIEHFADVARQPRRVGVVLARKGAFAVGVFDGDRLQSSKVDTSYVQGRTKAGGWSQKRYSRRRGNQADHAAGKAADAANRVLAPAAAGLDAVVTAGDRTSVDAVFKDPRLAGLKAKIVAPHIGDVGEPRLAVLKDMPARFAAVSIHLVEPESPDA
ncbi:MAG: acVLRF1 family peptidyl-tRNA hydrolase [Stackebrandtia sp.]